MIASLRGTVTIVDTAAIIIEAGGIGYSVRMSSKDISQLHAGQDVYILTTMTLSQDAIALYGFLHKSTQDLFGQLQKVSGIGPKAALAILSTLTPDELAHAIRENDVTALTKAPGVGKKGAQKIIVELSGSVNLDSLITEPEATLKKADTLSSDDDFIDSGAHQVVEGLMSLGWQHRDAVEAVKSSIEDMGLNDVDQTHIPLILRHALTRLDRGR
ncbi:Holliday junction branch migration protein RuvA [Alloscardovia venturai]|uniref:Holliday junction branch migration complex subunit RuvA n=1 Tax=Alloscardovia venturai TaxID=1769421 RepID=A0ABW2Y3Y4_9BIFI